MLQVIRDRAQGVFAWIIVGMISIPFALWGINSYFGGGGDNSVAEVDGVKISSWQVQNGYQQQRDRLAQMFGGKIPENLFSEEVLKRQVLEQLVDKELLIKLARDQRMRIGDQQLSDTITGIDAFYVDGKFDAQQYERVLAQQGMSPRLFEQRVRRDLIAGQFLEGASSSEFVLESEIDNHLQLQQQRRDMGYLMIPVSRYQKDVTVNADEVSAYYDSNSVRYMRPEQLSIDYLELKGDSIANGIEVSEEQMRQRYEAQKLNFRSAEERKARHILIQVAGNASEAEVTAAGAKADELLQRLKGGEDFSKLAIAESQDPGSAKSGGDLGYFGLGVMDKTFEQATFALQKGQLSEVVRSAFGFHIIKLDDIRGGETKPYEAVAADLKREMQMEAAAEIFYERSERFATLTYEQPDTLAAAAEALQLKVVSSELFTRNGGKGLTANPKVIEAAFSEDVLQRGNNSAPLEIGENHLVVLRIKEHQAEALRPLEEVKAEIESKLRHDKSVELAKADASAVHAKMEAGESAETVAAAYKLEWKRDSSVQRDNQQLDRTIVQTLFRMPHPQQGGATTQVVALASGDQAVVALYGVAPADLAKVEKKSRTEARQLLERASTGAFDQTVLAALRGRADITIKP